MTSASPLIAVIDDEEAVRKALRRLLQSAGMVVDAYSGGRQFLATLASRRPGCAVLDWHMPDLTGCDVLERLAQMQAGVPVIVITGHDSPDAEECALRIGAVAYLRKPIDGRLLLDTIAAAIAPREEPRAPAP